MHAPRIYHATPRPRPPACSPGPLGYTRAMPDIDKILTPEARPAEPRTIPCPAPGRHRAALHGRLLGPQGQRQLHLRRLRLRPVHQRHQVRLRSWLAQLLRGPRPCRRRGARRHHPRHAPRRGRLSPLRRPPRPRVPTARARPACAIASTPPASPSRPPSRRPNRRLRALPPRRRPCDAAPMRLRPLPVAASLLLQLLLACGADPALTTTSDGPGSEPGTTTSDHRRADHQHVHEPPRTIRPPAPAASATARPRAPAPPTRTRARAPAPPTTPAPPPTLPAPAPAPPTPPGQASPRPLEHAQVKGTHSSSTSSRWCPSTRATITATCRWTSKLQSQGVRAFELTPRASAPSRSITSR